MNKKRYVILTFVIIAIILCSNSLYSINNYADPIVAEDDTLDTEVQEKFDLEELYTFDYDYKDGYIRYCTEHAIFYSQSDYLNEDEIREFAKRVDTGIIEIETYLNMKLDSDHYINSRIFVNINDSMNEPEFNNENNDIEHTAIISVDNIKEKKAPYIHELIHLIAWEYSSTWIKEGLAIYLNDMFNGDPTYPNNGYDIDKLSLQFYNNGTLESLKAFDLLGENGFPNYEDVETEKIFYIFSASFVKYIENSIGTNDFIDIYKSSDTKNSLENITGKSIQILKDEWINHLKLEVK